MSVFRDLSGPDAEMRFETAVRANGDTFVKLVDGVPTWVRDAVLAAHGHDDTAEEFMISHAGGDDDEHDLHETIDDDDGYVVGWRDKVTT